MITIGEIIRGLIIGGIGIYLYIKWDKRNELYN